MRILWVHNFPRNVVSSGVFMYRMAEELQRTGVELDLYDTGSLRSAPRLFTARQKIARISRDYDVAHAQFGSACGLVTSRARCRRVLSLRGTDLLGCDTGPWWYRLHGRAARWMTRTSLPSYERVLVMSHRMRDELRRFHGRDRGVEYLPDGIDLERFRALDRMDARRQLGFPGDVRPWVLFGSIRKNNPIKRPQLAMAAFARAAARRTDLVMQTMSGVPHNEVPLWMSAANVLLMTSTREGWPNVVKEALACNVPFVSTNVSDLWRIAAAEPSCVVVDADPDALAKGILTAIEARSSATLRRHVEEMSLTKVAEQLRSIYEDLLHAPQRSAA